MSNENYYSENQIKIKKTFICGVCNKKFLDENGIKAHINANHSDQKASSEKRKPKYFKDKRVKCGVCHKYFSAKYLSEHLRIHSGEKPHVCYICNERFCHKKGLVVHIRAHRGEKPYSCEICNKQFSQISHLQTHYLTHSGVKQHSCDVCFMCFSLKSSLTRHKAIHMNDDEKPFKCDICKKGFSRKPYYEKHRLTHKVVKSDQKEYCKICDILFKSRHALSSHLGKYHHDETTLVCNVCNERFENAASLRQHYTLHSNLQAYFCDICNVHFSKLWHLERHNLRHNIVTTYICEHCDRVFKDSMAHNKHKRNCSVRKNDKFPILYSPGVESKVSSIESVLSASAFEESVIDDPES